MYESLRRELKVEVKNVWEDNRKNNRLNFSVVVVVVVEYLYSASRSASNALYLCY